MSSIASGTRLNWAIDTYNKDAMDALIAEAEKEIEKKLNEVSQKIHRWNEVVLRHNVTPPIKGEITKNKLRWRGIKQRCIFDSKQRRTEIWQRDKCIGILIETFEYERAIRQRTQSNKDSANV